MNAIEKMIDDIVKYSHIKDKTEVSGRLLSEFVFSGINVLDDFYKFKQSNAVNYFQHNENMDRFYIETDGFLFELAAWHCTYDRLQWKLNLVNDFKKRFQNQKLNVLMIGDGLGFDSLFLYENLKNLNISYFEFDNSKSFLFAKNMLKDKTEGGAIDMIGNLSEIKKDYYDVVVCLEVFEHLTSPKIVAKDIYQYLNKNGYLYISESFGAVELLRPTHLLSNNKYVGQIINIFEKLSFVYVDRLPPRIYIFSKNKHDKARFPKYIIRKLKNFIVGIVFKLKFKKIDNTKLDNEYLSIKQNMKLFYEK